MGRWEDVESSRPEAISKRPSWPARIIVVLLVALIVVVEGMNLSVYRTTAESSKRVQTSGTLLSDLATLQRHGFVWSGLYDRIDKTEIWSDIHHRRQDFGELQERLIADPSTEPDVRNDLLAIQNLLPDIDRLNSQLEASSDAETAADTLYVLKTDLNQLSSRTSRLFDREQDRYTVEIKQITDANETSQRNLLIASGSSGLMGLILLLVFWQRARSDLKRAYLMVLAESREREEVQHALHESELRYRSVLANVNEVVFECDATGAWTFLTPAWTELTGYTIEETLGRYFLEFVHPNESERLQAEFDIVTQEFASGIDTATLRRLETCYLTKDGEVLWMEVRYSLVAGPDNGSGPLFLGTLHDVSDRQKLETQLRQAQKLEAVGSLAAGIAHEINTPIQFIGDNLHFLQDAFETLVDSVSTVVPDEHQPDDIDFLRSEGPEAFSQAIDGVHRVATIVRAMKAFAHPDVSMSTPSDLNEALRNTAVVARSEYREVADVVFELEEIPRVQCSLSEINQVFLNFMVNSAHAIGDVVAGTDQRGTITIGTSSDETHVTITFSDTGAGIPDNIIGRIFDPFFTTKEVGKGTGQGLALTHSIIVDRHHGSIDVTSEVGRGTTFRVRLPTLAPPAQ